MAKMSISEAREKFSDVFDLAQHEAVFIEGSGQLSVVLISPQRCAELLETFEEAEDIDAFDAAISEKGKNLRNCASRARSRYLLATRDHLHHEHCAAGPATECVLATTELFIPSTMTLSS